jgi:hypothetical protein
MIDVWLGFAFYLYGIVAVSQFVTYWYFGWCMYDRRVPYGTINYYLNTGWGYCLCILLWPVMWIVRLTVGHIRVKH